MQGVVDFGNVYLETASLPFPVWIKNTGMADLVINTINVQQVNSAFRSSDHSALLHCGK
jgi:hypothetical protein